MERHIAHLDLDTFFVSVERLMNSKLNGQPVIIGGTADRGVVAACSYETRQFGVHSAMPMKLALRLCPQAVIVRGDYDAYSRYSKTVTDILTEAAPLVEKASIDEHYLDLSGMDKYFGCYKWLSELRHKVIKETGLPISFGLSINKTVSKIATGEAKPNGQINVLQGSEKPFLAPLPSKKIPMVGPKVYTTLRNMGLERIRTIQEMPVELMQAALGENGVTIWNKANGVDNSLVIPYTEQKSMSKNETFLRDTIDMDFLHRTLVKMVEDLSFDLRKQQRLTGCLAVTIKYSNFDTEMKQSRIPYTSSDKAITVKVLDLFKKLYSRRMLIRMLGVKFSDLVTGSYQISLFDDDKKDIALNRAMDNIRNRFGKEFITHAIIVKDAGQHT
ncbi:DNA polymerase IV [Chitinophagaceae bacterium IBVUCB1]|nr:DNA polymerase IV [Chitinophagaceae bacterium IBVUCB1]